MADPKARIALPTFELGLSLFSRLKWVPGETGFDLDTWTVVLEEFPRQDAELRELLDDVQSWLDQSGLDSLVVEAGGDTVELRAGAR